MLPRCRFLFAREFRELYCDTPPQFRGVVMLTDGSGCRFISFTDAERAALGLG